MSCTIKTLHQRNWDDWWEEAEVNWRWKMVTSPSNLLYHKMTDYHEDVSSELLICSFLLVLFPVQFDIRTTLPTNAYIKHERFILFLILTLTFHFWATTRSQSCDYHDISFWHSYSLQLYRIFVYGTPYELNITVRGKQFIYLFASESSKNLLAILLFVLSIFESPLATSSSQAYQRISTEF